MWGRAEYLLWWTKGLDTPVLATTSPAGTPRPQAGVLGAMNTAVLFGDDDLNRSSQSGARFTLGSWLDADECQGIEVTYLYVGEGRDQFQGATADFPILARPFFNTQNNSQDAKLISFPGAFAGDLDILATTEFQTWEVLLRHAGDRSPGSQLDYLFGYRYARLRDALSIVETTNALSPPLTGTRVDLLDQFHSRSRFHGFELGLSYQWRPTPLWEAELLAKVALGRTSSSVDVHGETTTRTAQGSSSTSPAGFLANSSNIGSFTDSRFGALSEFGFMLQRDLHYGLKARLGYTFIHWGSVTRADGQFDGAVNPGQIAAGNNSNGARATTSAGRSSYWAQGLNFGLSYDF